MWAGTWFARGSGDARRRDGRRGHRVRVLFAFVGGRGHFEPLVPIARAAVTAGHTVAFTCGWSMLAAVDAAGFRAMPTTPGRPEVDGLPDPRPLLEVDRAREERDLRELFARDGARSRAVGMLALAPSWQPDVIVCDEVDFGSMIAAERLGIPYASVIVLAAGGLLRPDVVGEALDEVRAANGLAPDPALEALSRHLVFSPAPPSFRDPGAPLPPTAQPVNVFAPDQDAAAPDRPWPAIRPDGPAVYATLGTIFNVESGDLFQRVLAGLRDHPGDVVLTVGSELDPAGVRRSAGPRPHRALPAAGRCPAARPGRALPWRLGQRAGRPGARPTHGPHRDGRRPAVECGALCGARCGPCPGPGPGDTRRRPRGRPVRPRGSRAIAKRPGGSATRCNGWRDRRRPSRSSNASFARTRSRPEADWPVAPARTRPATMGACVAR